MNLKSFKEFVVLMCACITTVDFALLPQKQGLSISLHTVPIGLGFIYLLSFFTSKKSPSIELSKILLTYSLASSMFVGILVPFSQAISYTLDYGFSFSGWSSTFGKWALLQFASGILFALFAFSSFFILKKRIST